MRTRPCPFCGSDDLDIKSIKKTFKTGVQVACKKCGGARKPVWALHEDEPSATQGAIQLWNERAMNGMSAVDMATGALGMAGAALETSWPIHTRIMDYTAMQEYLEGALKRIQEMSQEEEK